MEYTWPLPQWHVRINLYICIVCVYAVCIAYTRAHCYMYVDSGDTFKTIQRCVRVFVCLSVCLVWFWLLGAWTLSKFGHISHIHRTKGMHTATHTHMNIFIRLTIGSMMFSRYRKRESVILILIYIALPPSYHIRSIYARSDMRLYNKRPNSKSAIVNACAPVCVHVFD